jgi:hypothetical protein
MKSYVLFRVGKETNFDPKVATAVKDDNGVLITVRLEGNLSWAQTPEKAKILAEKMNQLFEGTATASLNVWNFPERGEFDTLEVRLTNEAVNALYTKIKEKDLETLTKAEAPAQRPR